MDQAEFEQKFGHVGRKGQHVGGRSKELVKHCLPPGQCCSPKGLVKRAVQLVPIFGWLPRYSPRQCLHCNLITGLTVGIMVVPQGMAYATLAKVAPVYGLYSCFFAAFFYMFFGTFAHVSIGTFAEASMMLGNVRSELVPDPVVNGTGHEESVKGSIDFGYPVTPIMLTSALGWHLPASDGFVQALISDQLHFGPTRVRLHHRRSNSCADFTDGKVDWHQNQELPWAGHDHLCDCCNHFLHSAGFKQNFGVKVVDHVPDGMPLPALPQLDLLPHMWIEAVSISIICYVFMFSLSKIFAKNHKYKWMQTKNFKRTDGMLCIEPKS